jgi:D-alanyl-lipoteichoic acid acyltransferase DltB (MBOAT superfamily)
VGSTVVDYAAGLAIERAEPRSARARAALWLSLIFNLGMLVSFKYLGFFADILMAWTGAEFDVFRALVLPLGISFYTFQTLSYTIDVYYGRVPAERHIGRFATFISFFPQLLAGPIERASDLLPQMAFTGSITTVNLTLGLRRILWGLFKKLVVADRIAILIEPVFENPALYHPAMMWGAALLFLVQVFCDFSSYSDLAVGTARIFGATLSENFAHRAYWVRSFRTFWEGWHRTMTGWFRDYVFFSLSTWRSGRVWLLVFTLLTFSLNGLWHGARWTFVAWGALNGLFMVVETVGPKWRLGRLDPLISWLLRLPLVVLLAILFRAENLGQAWDQIRCLLPLQPRPNWSSSWAAISFDSKLGLMLLLLMDFIHLWLGERKVEDAVGHLHPHVRFALYVTFTASIFWLGVTERERFVYFEF